MSEFGEMFRVVWFEFQHIIEIIHIQCSETSGLVSLGESSPVFVEAHKGLITQAKETVWRAYNNEKKLKKFYYKIESIIKPIERSFLKVSLNYLSCINSCNTVHTALEEYTETQVPRFLAKVKETGNHFKIQVNKLIWKEDESAENRVQDTSNKQPKIFFSNNILSVMCQATSLSCCNLQKKSACPKTLSHFTDVFELTAQVFANINNLSRILLIVKLSLEKFKHAMSDLQSLTQSKLSYYKTFSPEFKIKVTNDKLYRIIARFLKIQRYLIEQQEKLESFSFILSQIQYCSSTCIPIPQPFNTEKLNLNSFLSRITFQVAFIIKFVTNLLSHTLSKKTPTHRPLTFVQERSFLFTIFHIRSILLQKMQPYTLAVNLKRYSSLLYSYLVDHLKNKEIRPPFPVKIVNGKKNSKASFGSNKQVVNSYNSSWDLQENETTEDYSEFDEELEYEKFRKINRKRTQKVSRTPDLSPIVVNRVGSKKGSEYFLGNEIQSATLPGLQSLQSTSVVRVPTAGQSDVAEMDFGFFDKIKQLRSANAGFLSHRIQRIQNNRSISPLTKIEYIREEFANNFKPVDLKLRNSLMKLKNKSTFLYTMK